MGLYLAIFDGDEEIDGVEVGSYADFATFRSAVSTHVEGGVAGSRCPTLMNHSDCDGLWSPEESALLQSELVLIAKRFMELPPEPLGDGWKTGVAKMFGIRPASLYESFFDIDGEPLLDRLMGLARISVERKLPILFQ
ncbi:hypothetical protein GCM10022253_29910 [Sphingomonas endophytica]|uniref:Uncharacterized protein n=1 Tax=Sphingomonas endophytica TaxID=869719 RepID=A0ABR6N772_9SPHN|nr:Imm70 family immunity protein [Sphingomonas endophytica]MBB5726643.1 hypothetical protein [Sphingomonas endophytica]